MTYEASMTRLILISVILAGCAVSACNSKPSVILDGAHTTVDASLDVSVLPDALPDVAFDTPIKADACVPQCSNRICGADPACGVSCGICSGVLMTCTSAGLCVDPSGLAVEGKGYSSRGESIAIDTSGNLYVTGVFRQTLTFGSITLTAEEQDLFVAKFDSNGQVLWAKSAGGKFIDDGLAIGVDGAGNVYVAGDFETTATFGSMSVTSEGHYDVYVTKLDGNGNFLWVKTAGGKDHDSAEAISVAENGHVYLAGKMVGNGAFGDITYSTQKYDAFIAAMDSDGNWKWVTTGDGAGDAWALGIAHDADHVVATGYFTGTATFGTKSVGDFPSGAMFTVQLTTVDGTVSWATAARSDSGCWGNGVAIDGTGNTFVAGLFQGTATFGTTTLNDQSGGDIFVTKLDPNGQFIWTSHAGGTQSDSASDIVVDTAGNAYLTGWVQGDATFGVRQVTTSAGSWDAFAAKIDGTGKFVWADTAGGKKQDWGNSIVVDPNGRTFSTGQFNGSAQFGATTLSTTGNGAMFLWRWP